MGRFHTNQLICLDQQSNKILRTMLKVLWISTSFMIAAIIWYFAESTAYTPTLIAPFTQINAILLAIAGAFAKFRHQKKALIKKVNTCWAIILGFLGIYASISLNQCSIYPFPLMWLVTSASLLASSFKIKKRAKIEHELHAQIEDENFEEYSQKMQQLVQIPTKRKKYFINNFLFVAYIIIVCLFTYNTKRIAEYKQKFPILGHTITMNITGEHSKATFHYYCSDIMNSKIPTVVLEHGGGGNLVGFLPLVDQLKKYGIKACVFDRLGYGRSSKVVPNQSLKMKSQITNNLLEHILRPDERVIYGGWSAGVQLSIAYSYFFPGRIDGLIFMDGYPDYLYLQAIQSNSSTIRNSHTLFISQVFRFLQPYGLGLLFGANQIPNPKYNQYYQAYYRTGYLWDSQSTELMHMNSTNELSELARQAGAFEPYPTAQIYLNWPDIPTPLLIMPANNTVSGSNGLQYKVQSEKYLQKCTNQLKKLEVIQGAHDFVLISFQKVGRIIKEFVEQIIQSS